MTSDAKQSEFLSEMIKYTIFERYFKKALVCVLNQTVS